jgi:hypothetical protein
MGALCRLAAYFLSAAFGAVEAVGAVPDPAVEATVELATGAGVEDGAVVGAVGGTLGALTLVGFGVATDDVSVLFPADDFTSAYLPRPYFLRRRSSSVRPSLPLLLA